MGGHTHHRAGAVVGQHVVRGPDGQPLPGQRVHSVTPQGDPGALPVRRLALDVRDCAECGPVAHELITVLLGDQPLGQSGIGGHHHERHSIESVRARREDLDGVHVGSPVSRVDLKSH